MEREHLERCAPETSKAEKELIKINGPICQIYFVLSRKPVHLLTISFTIQACENSIFRGKYCEIRF
jgi:hypothetical protein